MVSSFEPATYLEELDIHPLGGRYTSEIANECRKKVTKACDGTMPRKAGRSRRPPVYWWNGTIDTLRYKCNAARRVLQRGRKTPRFPYLEATYKGARRKFTLFNLLSNCWKELLVEVEADAWGQSYRVVMTQLKSQPIPSPSCPKILEKIVTTLFPQQPELSTGRMRSGGDPPTHDRVWNLWKPVTEWATIKPREEL